MRIGSHVPTGGGLLGAVDSARSCGAEAAQIWGSNPKAWAAPRIDPDRCETFREAWRAAGLGPLFLHAPYMVNVASPNPDFRRRSVELASATLALAEAIAATGVVVHAGSGGARSDHRRVVDLAAESLARIAARARRALVLVELTAGGAGSVAATLPQARDLFDAAARRGSDGLPLALCLDTCHLFAAGYPLHTPQGVDETFAELGRLGLTEKLVLVHANDSTFGLGQRRDSHTHIGQGHIGEAGFRAILAQSALCGRAVVCETPGRLEDHKRNVAALRRLAPPPRSPGQGSPAPSIAR